MWTKSKGLFNMFNKYFTHRSATTLSFIDTNITHQTLAPRIKVYLWIPLICQTVALLLQQMYVFTANTQNSLSGLRHNFVISTTVALSSGQNAYQAATQAPN